MVKFHPFVELVGIILILLPLTHAAISPPQPAKITTYNRGDIGLTGDLSITIPLVNVEGTGGMSFPIVAHYQAGIKVDQPAGYSGLGWNIELGHIERIPMNIVDFHNSDDKSTPVPDYRFTNYDPFPDAFLAVFPTGSIKFYNINTVDNPIFVPETENSPYSIKVLDTDCISYGSYACDYTGFVLTSSDGMQYVYSLGVKETVADMYDDGDESRDPTSTAGPSIPGNMRWLLTSILEPNYKDGGSPDLDYAPLNSVPNNKGNWIAITYLATKKYHYIFEGDSRIFHKEEIYPSQIRTRDFYASFDYLNDGSSGTPVDYLFTQHEINPGSPVPDKDTDNTEKEPTKHLNAIFLYSPSGTLIKTISFEYNTRNNIALTLDTANPVTCKSLGIVGIPDGTYLSRLMLTKIQISGRNSVTYPDYEFAYYPGPNIYGDSYIPSCDRSVYNFRDILGYYTTNQDGFDIRKESSAESDFDTVNGYEEAKVWSLHKISYPTGLLTQYTYNNDQIYQDFTVRDSAGNVRYSDTTNRKYYAGGVRFISSIVSDVSGGNSYTYSQQYLNNQFTATPENLGIVSRIPQAFLENKLGNSYFFMHSVFQDIPEFVYYPQTTAVPPGNTGYITRKFSYNENPWGFDGSGIISGTSICLENLLNGPAWCESSSDYGGKILAAFIPDPYDGFIAFPYSTEYYDQSGNIVKKEEQLENNGAAFPWSKILEYSPGKTGGNSIFTTKVHLPAKSKITIYDPLDATKKVTTATSYSYADKGPLYDGLKELSRHAILPTSTTTCKTDAVGNCIGSSKSIITAYAFEDPGTPQNMKDLLKQKFMLSLPSSITTPEGITKYSYKIYAD